MSEPLQKPAAVALRNEKGQLLPGSALNPGGRSKKLREIEQMMEREHLNPDNLRKVFKRLRSLAMGRPVEIWKDGKLVEVQLRAEPGFMKLYLERVLGPVADDDAVTAKAEKMLRALLEEAEQEARKNRNAIDVEVK